MSVTITLQGRDYVSTDADGYGYMATRTDTDLPWFWSLLTDLMAEMESATAVQSVAPSSAGNVLLSDGSAWVRSDGSGVTALLDALTVAGAVAAGSFTGPLTGDVTGDLTGNADTATSATLAASATKLATARAIFGYNFDGTAAIGPSAPSTGSVLIFDGTNWIGSHSSGVAALLDALTLGGTTVTTSTPLMNATQTWNASGVAFTALKLNVTNTASASGSLLLDLQVGTVSKFSVDKTGKIIAGAASLTTINTTGAITIALDTVAAVTSKPVTTGDATFFNWQNAAGSQIGYIGFTGGTGSGSTLVLANAIGNIFFGGPSGTELMADMGIAFKPFNDNAIACGGAGNRWSAVYAVNGTIQTSTKESKDLLDVQPRDADVLAAIRDAEIAAFTYKDDRGYDAAGHRHRHFGVMHGSLPAWLQTTDDALSPMSIAALGLRGVQLHEARIAALEARLTAN